jgi:hypothetical protein
VTETLLTFMLLQIKEEGKKRINLLEGPDGPVTE